MQPKKLIVLFAVICCFTNTAIANTPSQAFFESVLKSIDAAEGRVVFYFTKGFFRKKLQDREVILELPENSVAICDFSYKNGILRKCNLTFPIPIILRDGSSPDCIGLKIKSLSYDGILVLPVTEPLNNSLECRNKNTKIETILKRNFEFNNSPNDFFRGNIFKYTNNMLFCTNQSSNCNVSKSIIEQVKITPDDTHNSGLYVTLQKKSTINFSSPNATSNFLTTDESENGVIIDFLTYHTDDNSFDGKIGKFKLSLLDGRFLTQNCSLYVGSGSSCEFNNLTFSKNSATSNINLDGRFSISTGDGTKIGISNIRQPEKGAKSPNAVGALNLNPNSTLVINQFSYQTSGDTDAEIKFGPGTNCNLNIKSGVLEFNNTGYINLTQSSIIADIAATFGTRNNFAFLANFRRVDLTFNKGKLPINSATTIILESGILKTSSLTYNSNNTHVLQGTLEYFRSAVSLENKIKIPNGGFEMAANNPGEIYASNSDNPIKFTSDDYPEGELFLSLPFSAFSSGANKDISIHDGFLTANIIHSPDFFRMKNIQIGGKMKINYIQENIKLENIIPIKIYSGEVTYATNSKPLFKGKLSFSIPPFKKDVEFITPCLNDDQINIEHAHDEHLYPVKLLFNLNKEIEVNDIDFVFDGDHLNDFSKTTDAEFVLKVPGGCGYYDADNDNCDQIAFNCPDGSRRSKQELVRADFGLCTIHLSLDIEPYYPILTFNLSYKFIDGKRRLLLNIMDVKNMNEIKYTRDGCEFTEEVVRDIMTILNGLGFIKSDKLNVNQMINKSVQENVRKKILEVTKSFEIVL